MNELDARFIHVDDPGDEDATSVGTIESIYLGSTEDEIALRPGMKLSLSSQIAPEGYTLKIDEPDCEK